MQSTAFDELHNLQTSSEIEKFTNLLKTDWQKAFGNIDVDNVSSVKRRRTTPSTAAATTIITTTAPIGDIATTLNNNINGGGGNHNITGNVVNHSILDNFDISFHQADSINRKLISL
jgi:hypothetical protein